MITQISLYEKNIEELDSRDLKREVASVLKDILDSSSDNRKIFKICLVEAKFATEEERKEKGRRERGKVEIAGSFIIVKIYTSRPGLLIGKRGRYFDFIKASLEYALQYNVEVDLIETYIDYL